MLSVVRRFFQARWERTLVRVDHLIEVAHLLARLKEEAIASSRWSHGLATAVTSRGVVLGYQVERNGPQYRHVLSVAGTRRGLRRLAARDLLGWIYELLDWSGGMSLAAHAQPRGFSLELTMKSDTHDDIAMRKVLVPTGTLLPARIVRARGRAQRLTFGALAEPGYL